MIGIVYITCAWSVVHFGYLYWEKRDLFLKGRNSAGVKIWK